MRVHVAVGQGEGTLAAAARGEDELLLVRGGQMLHGDGYCPCCTSRGEHLLRVGVELAEVPLHLGVSACVMHP